MDNVYEKAMVELTGNLVGRWLNNQNKNYIPLLKEIFPEPAFQKSPLEVIWESETRRVIYRPHLFRLEARQRMDEKGIYWKLITVKCYPSRLEMEQIRNWLLPSEPFRALQAVSENKEK